jgi:L-ascorbate metabolism protein UlaG (beta-lactamase superfamily)
VVLLAPASAAVAHAPPGAVGGAAVAAPQQQAETIAARQRFFGKDNVDAATGSVRADRVIFSWYGVTNFAAAIRGHVVLLDAWVARGAHSGYIPTTTDELALLKPSHIFIGHAHFDHAADAVPLATATGATLVGLGEHCAELTARAPAMPPRCVSVVPAGAEPGTTGHTDVLDGVEITAVKHLHSGGTKPDGSDSGGYHVPVTPPPSTTIAEHPATPQDVEHLVDHAQDAEGGSVLYRFRVAGTSFLWNDTAGPLKDNAPQTFKAFEALRPIDVQLGAIQGFNQITNGMRDVRMYLEAFQPKVFVPTHHDDWLVGITTNGAAYEPPLRTELGRMAPERRPQVRFITDPADYIRPEALTFPLELGKPELARRCTAAGLRVRLTGETAHVRSVRFALGRASSLDTAAPFEAIFGRRSRATRLEARVTLVDGAQLKLARPAPRCRA